MAHITRKELKKDEFRDTLEHGAEVLTTHKRLILQVAVVVVVAACAIFGWRYYSSHRNAKASAAFTVAMKTFDGQVVPAGQSPPPGVLTFPTDAAKYTAAQKAMASVAKRYPHALYGRMARYYVAVSLDHLGKHAEAVRWLQPIAGGGGGKLQALAKFELAHAYDQMGKSGQALALYRQLASRPSVFVPKPLVLLALGDHYRARNNTPEAVKYYQQVKSEFPNTSLADQADQRLEMLGKS